MKIINRQPENTADASASRGTAFSELYKLMLYATALAIAIFFAVGVAVDAVVPHISYEREAKLFKYFPMRFSDGPAKELAEMQEILSRLESLPDTPSLPYRLVLLHSPSPNAFAFPGGTIGVTKGLLDTLDNEIELAFVLGHEIGHFKHRDHLRGTGRILGVSILYAMIFGGEMGSETLSKTYQYVLQRGYSRDQEDAADHFGIDLVYQAYGKTAGCDELFKHLLLTDETPEWAYMFSTHPSPEQRIQNLKIYADQLK